MSVSILFEILTAWQFICACIALMLLLPLVFYLASRRPPRRLAVEIPRPKKRREKDLTVRSGRKEEEDERGRRPPMHRKAIEDGDEIDYPETKTKTKKK